MSETHDVLAVGSTDLARFINEYGRCDVSVQVRGEYDNDSSELRVRVSVEQDTVPVVIELEATTGDPMPLYSGLPDHDESPAQTLEAIRQAVTKYSESDLPQHLRDANAMLEIERLLAGLIPLN